MTTGNRSLVRLNHQRDLGIVLDSKLSFNYHVDHIVAKANRIVGFIKRNFSLIDNVPALRRLFVTIVRPILEYNTVIFNSISKHQAKRIESIQKRFLRFLHVKHGFHKDNSVWCNCDDDLLCNFYNIPKLHVRRNIFDCVFLRRCLLSYFNCSDCVSLFGLNIPRLSARRRDLIYIPRNRVDVTKKGFIGRISRLFNTLNSTSNIDIFADSLQLYKANILEVLSM